MPDKIYKKGCGGSCIRCWQNKLKHGNKEAKAYIAKQIDTLNSENQWDVTYPEEDEHEDISELSIEMDQKDSIKVLKTKIQDQTNIVTGKQELYFDGVELQDTRKLKYYKITPNSLIKLRNGSKRYNINLFEITKEVKTTPCDK
jgi:hypothetical protein